MLDERLQSLPQRIARMESEVRSMKAPQPSTGDGWIVYRIQTEDTWDLEITAGGSSYDQTFNISVDYADGTNSALRFVHIILIDDQDFNGTGGSFGYNYASTGIPQRADSINLRVRANSDYNAAHILRFKFVGFSPYKGTFNVSPITEEVI